jgi:hypothetical protein
MENVPGFDVDHLRVIFDETYSIETTLLCPTAVGWPVRRMRRWTILLRRGALMPSTPSLLSSWIRCHRERAINWRHFMIASQDEVEAH